MTCNLNSSNGEASCRAQSFHSAISDDHLRDSDIRYALHCNKSALLNRPFAVAVEVTTFGTITVIPATWLARISSFLKYLDLQWPVSSCAPIASRACFAYIDWLLVATMPC